MTIFDISVCGNCRKVISVAGSYGVNVLVVDDVLNPIEEGSCTACTDAWS